MNRYKAGEGRYKIAKTFELTISEAMQLIYEYETDGTITVQSKMNFTND